MSFRKIPLVNDSVYHIYNRSIAKYQIFNNSNDYLRMMEIIDLFHYTDFQQPYSNFIRLTDKTRIDVKHHMAKTSQKIVDIIADCLMPTHFHLILKQNIDNGITAFMARVLNSYSRYFNTFHQRKGPLWENHFSNKLIQDDDLLLHITRYLHLNAVTANLVERPEEWLFSSYNEYIDKKKEGICEYKDILDIKPVQYQKFVNDQIGYQKELAKIKHLLIENYPDK